MQVWLLGNYSAGAVYVSVDFEPFDPNSVTIGFYWVKGSDTPPASGTYPQDSKTFQRGVSEVRQVNLPLQGEGNYYVYYTLDGGTTWRKLGEMYVFGAGRTVAVFAPATMCTNGMGIAIVNYGGKLWAHYVPAPIVGLPKDASDAFVEIWCTDVNKVFVGLFKGPFSEGFAVTPDITPPVKFSFDITFNGTVTDGMVDSLNRFLSNVLSAVGVYKVSDRTVRVVSYKSGPGFPVAFVGAIMRLLLGVAAVIFSGGYFVESFSNLQRQQAVDRYINETLPRVVDRYAAMVNQCLQISDEETKRTCLKAASQAIDPALSAGNAAAGSGGGQPQQQQFNFQWMVIALAFLAILLLASRR